MMFKIVKGELAIRAADHLTKADKSTRSNHPHKFRHLTTHCEQYRKPVVSADTTTSFLAHMPTAL